MKQFFQDANQEFSMVRLCCFLCVATACLLAAFTHGKSIEIGLPNKNNRKKSKKSLDFQLTLQTSNVPLFTIFKLSFLHPFESVKSIDMKENYIVTKAVRDDGCLYTLLEYKNVDFVVTVPKVLNYSKF